MSDENVKRQKKRKKKPAVSRKKKRGMITVFFFCFVLLVILALVFLISRSKVSFSDQLENAKKTSGIFYRSFIFTVYNQNNENSPYPVLDSKTSRYFFKSAETSNALTDKIFEDVRFPTGFYLNNEKDKKYIAAVKSGGKWGYIYFQNNDAGKLARVDGYYIDLKFDDAEPFYNGIAAVLKNGKYGFINTSGNFVIEPNYDSVKYYNEGLIPVSTGGLWYYIDMNQKQILGPFEEAESFSEGCACVKQDGLWGIIDKNGQYLVTPAFEDIWSVHNGSYYVFEHGGWDKKAL